MVSFDIRSNVGSVRAQLSDLQKKHLPRAQVAAATRTGAYVFAALKSQMEESFDRVTPYALRGLRFRRATMGRAEVNIWLEESPNKGIAPADFLAAEIEGGVRRHKRMEKALQAKGLMPKGWFAVPGRQAPLDAYGNVPGPFIVRMLSDLQAFGEQGYRANRKGARRGAKKSNYFFVPRKGSHLKPGVYWHMPNQMVGVVFTFVSKVHYEKRFDFYGVGRRAYNRVAERMMTEELSRLIRSDNR